MDCARPIMGIARRTVGLLVVALAAAACSNDQPDAPRVSDERAPAEVGGASPAPGNTGTIEVRVTYGGAPVVETLRINKDTEQCGEATTIEKLLVGDHGGLANAVVSVAAAERSAVVSRVEPQLDQRGCAFRPRVLAMQAGELEILNSDGVLHNIHTYSTANATINKAQPKFKKTMTVTFSEPEIVKVTCDVHSWMQAWVAVFAHPYFDVTDAQGIATIEKVPAGPHTIELWHEVLGRRTREVEVKAGDRTQVAFDWETS
ncbi:MAG: hypothetical protein HYU41_03300 [Candidatus Rokubacteria bacterium]|nr:hypothetical protein [Candidatus Rokubacteria bacterium]